LKRIINLDVLISINIFITYFVLLGTGKFLSLKLRRLRLILASLLGGSFSLMIYLPRFPGIISLIIKFLLSLIMLLLAFKTKSFKNFLKILAVFYMTNFIFFGIVFSLWYFMSPPGLWLRNGIIYLNISPLFLAICTLISYFIFRFINKLSERQVPKKLFTEIILEDNNKKINLRAKIDTGHTLKEPFSSLPVIIINKNLIKNFIPEDLLISKEVKKINSKFRLIPFQTISNSGILLAFKPEKIFLKQEKKLEEKEAYIAPCENNVLLGDYEALVSPELL